MTVALDKARRTMCKSLSFVGSCGAGFRFCGAGRGGTSAILNLCCDESSGADLRGEYCYSNSVALLYFGLGLQSPLELAHSRVF